MRHGTAVAYQVRCVGCSACKKRKGYAGRHGLWEALDGSMASRSLTGVSRVGKRGEGGICSASAANMLHAARWDFLP